MPKLRKMLGDVNSAECIALMRLIETQNEKTLAGWAVGYAKDNFLGIYENECPGNACLRDTILTCEEYLKGSGKLSEIKPVIKEAGQLPGIWRIIRPRRLRRERFQQHVLRSIRRPARWDFCFMGPQPQHTARPDWNKVLRFMIK